MVGESAAIGILPMINVQDMDFASLIVNAISDPVLAASCPPQAFKRGLERCADATRLPPQWSVDELPRSERGCRWQALAQCSSRAGSQDHLERLRSGLTIFRFALFTLLVHEPAVVP